MEIFLVLLILRRRFLMKKVLSFLILILLTFSLFAEEVAKEIIKKTEGVTNGEALAILIGVILLFALVFIGGWLAEQSSYPE